jgi:hypothetical protein
MATPARLVLSLTAALVLVGHPASRVPAGVGTIDVHSPRGSSRRVTDPDKVAKIVGWIDRLKKVPPGEYACPAMVVHPRHMTLDFRDAAGRQLARATYRFEFGDRTLTSGPCNPIVLTVRGHSERALLGAHFLVRVQRLLGIRLG